MSRVFDLICIRSYDFIMWWFDLDFILFDFIFDVLSCITFIFVFIIGFFIRIMFSFIFVLLLNNNIAFLSNVLLVGFCILLFIFIIYNFICYFFTFGVAYLIFFFEFLLLAFKLIVFDFISFSSHVWLMFGVFKMFFTIFCSYLFSLFYFIIVFLFCFIFFIIRCLFTIIYDYLFFNFDIHLNSHNISILHIDFNELYILTSNYIFNISLSFFSFFFICSILFILSFYLVSIFFTYNLASFGVQAILLCTCYWVYINYSRVFSPLLSALLVFFKYVYNELFFIFTFILIIFVTSFFGFMVKDFVFLNIFFDLFTNLVSYDHCVFTSFTWNKMASNIVSLLTLYS